MNDFENIITEKDFTTQLKHCDKNLFEKIFKHFYNRLCSYAESFLGDPAEAEDIVCDFFVYFWENKQNLEISSSLSSYLFAAIRNRSLNYIKHLSVKDKYKTIIQAHYSNGNQFDKSNNNSKSDLDALQKKIDDTLQNLPNQCRRVFIMSRYEEKKYEEIAEELNISRNAVKKHIVKALAQMRKNLREAEFLELAIPLLLWLYTN